MEGCEQRSSDVMEQPAGCYTYAASASAHDHSTALQGRWPENLVVKSMAASSLQLKTVLAMDIERLAVVA